MYLALRNLLTIAVLFLVAGSVHADTEYNNLYNEAYSSGLTDDAQRCADYANANGDLSEKAAANLLLAYTALKHDMYYLALESYFSALDYYRELDDEKTQADIIESIGIIYRKASAYDEAIGYYQDALKLKLKFGDSTQIARSYYNIGRVYRLAEHYDEAVDFFKRAMTIYIEQKNWRKVSETNNELGVAMASNEMYAEAIYHYSKITDSLEEGSAIWIRQETLRLNNLASLCLRQQDFECAKPLIKQAMNADYNNDILPQTRSLLHFNLAKVYDYEEKKDSLIMSYRAGLENVDDDFDQEVIASYSLLADYYDAAGASDSAIVYYKRLADIAKRLSELQHTLKEHNIRYQVEAATHKKEKEMAAAAELQTKIIYSVVNGIGAVLLLVFAHFAYQRYKRKREMDQREAADVLDDFM